ncbi:MAG TPA: RHS repeat-associated core domain-containing protein [Candidatus Angelobacter sp.]|nr:RHS repeat-associated core domain-containing protein [Candidatus Angelobacter sp.]
MGFKCPAGAVLLSNRVVRIMLLAGMVLGTAFQALGQNAPDLTTAPFESGLRAFGSYHGGQIDNISLQTGSPIIDIPLISYPQRGGKLALNFVLHYQNLPWFDVESCSSSGSTTVCSTVGPPQYEHEFQVLETGASLAPTVFPGSVAFTNAPGPPSSAIAQMGPHCNQLVLGSGSQYTCSPLVVEADGASHPLIPTSPTSYEAADGSGFRMDFNLSQYLANTSGASVVVTDANGTRYTYPSNSSGSAISVTEDTNGNQISLSSGNSGAPMFWTDTLGRTITAAVYGGSGALNATGCSGPLPIVATSTWTPPGISGGTYPIKFCYVSVSETLPAALSFFAQTYTATLLQSVVLPSGQTWTFQYTNDGKGDLSQVTFPSGGTLSYTWITGPLPAQNSFPRAIQTRTLNSNDGSPAAVWHYNYAGNPFQANAQFTTTVTDPLNNDTVHTFGSLGSAGNFQVRLSQEQQTQFYSGSSSGGTLLKTLNYDYQYTDAAGSFHGPILPVPVQVPIRVTTTWPNGQTSKVESDYDGGFAVACVSSYDTNGNPQMCSGSGGNAGSAIYGRVVATREFDYGSGTPGPLLRTTTPNYAAGFNGSLITSPGTAGTSYLGNNLLNLKTGVSITDGAGNSAASTTFSYDTTSPNGAPQSGGAVLVASSITTQHDGNPPSGNFRGNLSFIQKQLFGTNGTSVNTQTIWFDTGELSKKIDALGNATTYSYSGTFAGAYPTQSCNALNQCASRSYDFNTGLPVSATDLNNQTTTYAYDTSLRPTLITDPPQLLNGSQAHGSTSFSYPDAVTVQRIRARDASNNITDYTYFDGLGRTKQTRLVDAAGDDFVDTTYDPRGRVATVSNPHRTAASSNNGLTQSQYDALGRLTQTTQPDGSVSSVLYTGSCATATDEASKSRKSCSDGLGRLTSVFEDPTGLNYETDYQYDALGNLLRVDQKGSSPADSTQWRTRLFTYDSLSRLLTASNPESGTIAYQYDANGNLTQKTAPAPNQTGSATVTTAYAYDHLNRLTETSHSDGTPITLYGYDETSGWGNTLANTIGRRSSATTFKSFGQPYIQGTVFSYDSLGRNVDEWECIPSSCTPNFSTYHMSASYDLAGNMTTLTYPDSRVVAFQYNAANRLNQVQFTQYQGAAAPGGTFYYWSVHDTDFSPDGTPLFVALGNPVSERVTLNNRLQLAQKTVVSSNLGTFANHTFNYGTSNNNGNLLSVADQISSAYTQTFTYDSLNRLATAGESRWGNSYVYDAWGNYLQQNTTSGSSFSHQFQADGNNRLVGYSYDAAGNMLNDKTHAYVFDGENRLLNVDSGAATYTYDADGERVRKDAASGSTEYVSFGGEIIAERNVGNGLWSDYVFANGKRIAMAYTFNNEMHLHGVNCSNCGSQYADFLLPYSQGYNGYVIQSGDKLIFEQYQPTGVHGGMYISFTDGTGMLGQVNDSDGQPVADDGIQNTTHFRTVDLSSFAGKTINLVSFHLDPSTAAGAWDLFFDSAVITSADGSVRPLWTHEETVTLTPGATSGISGLSYEVRKSIGTLPIVTTTFYDDDQIGSSRLMTDGFGMPVWQGTFLPYGEEYNPELTANHYKFTGKERDTETNLDYFGARYYSSGLGRWLTPDWAANAVDVPYAEFADPQSLNQYTYVRNIPTVNIDPDGHDCPTTCPVDEPTPADLELINQAGAKLGRWATVLPGVLGGVLLEQGLEYYAKTQNIKSQTTFDEIATENRIILAKQAARQQQLGQARGADEDKSQSDDANDKARTNGGYAKPDPPTGRGTVPPDQRDPKRTWTKPERQQRLDQQGGKCPRCGKPKTLDETQGHHKKRHADGGRTDGANHDELCKDCHKEVHQPN